MSRLRTLASALCIVVGALLIAAWAASTAALSAVENGTVIDDVAERALTSAPVQDALIARGTDAVLAALGDAGVRADIPGVEAVTGGIIEAIVRSGAFADLVHAQVASMREQTVAALGGDAEGPIVVTLDVSAQVNERLAAVPVIGGSLPTLAVPAVPVQIMDAGAAHTARTTWEWLHVATRWFGWLGLGCVCAGILVSHRRRWYAAKLALALGVISAVGWAVVRAAEPQTLAAWLPGDGPPSTLLVETVDRAQGDVGGMLGRVALVALIVAVVLFVIAARRPRR